MEHIDAAHRMPSVVGSSWGQADKAAMYGENVHLQWNGIDKPAEEGPRSHTDHTSCWFQLSVEVLSRSKI